MTIWTPWGHEQARNLFYGSLIVLAALEPEQADCPHFYLCRILAKPKLSYELFELFVTE